MTTSVTRIARWLPQVDYLIDPAAFSVAYCCYCLMATDYVGYRRALAQITQHLDDEHAERRMQIPVPRQG